MLKLKCKSLRFDGGFFVTLRMSERNEANCHKNVFSVLFTAAARDSSDAVSQQSRDNVG